jgi:hypothetical protein
MRDTYLRAFSAFISSGGDLNATIDHLNYSKWITITIDEACRLMHDCSDALPKRLHAELSLAIGQNFSPTYSAAARAIRKAVREGSVR